MTRPAAAVLFDRLIGPPREKVRMQAEIDRLRQQVRDLKHERTRLRRELHHQGHALNRLANEARRAAFPETRDA